MASIERRYPAVMTIEGPVEVHAWEGGWYFDRDCCGFAPSHPVHDTSLLRCPQCGHVYLSVYCVGAHDTLDASLTFPEQSDIAEAKPEPSDSDDAGTVLP